MINKHIINKHYNKYIKIKSNINIKMDCVQLMDNIITDVINIKPIIETNDKTNNSE